MRVLQISEYRDRSDLSLPTEGPQLWEPCELHPRGLYLGIPVGDSSSNQVTQGWINVSSLFRHHCGRSGEWYKGGKPQVLTFCEESLRISSFIPISPFSLDFEKWLSNLENIIKNISKDLIKWPVDTHFQDDNRRSKRACTRVLGAREFQFVMYSITFHENFQHDCWFFKAAVT